MLPVIEGILGLVMGSVKAFLPATPEDKLKVLEIALRETLANNELLTKQMAVNQAEAANPNRTWVTWREALGYVLVFGIAYQWAVLPLLSLIAQVSGHPLNLEQIYTVDIVDVLYIMMGMLGLDAGPMIANRIKGTLKK